MKLPDTITDRLTRHYRAPLRWASLLGAIAFPIIFLTLLAPVFEAGDWWVFAGAVVSFLCVVFCLAIQADEQREEGYAEGFTDAIMGRAAAEREAPASSVRTRA